MNRPGYREAVQWLAYNDDCYWLLNDIISVPAAMVRDLWDVSTEKLIKDLRAALACAHPKHEALRP